MPPQPAKKQKTEDEPKAAVEGEEEPKAEEAVESEKPKEPEKPKELEDDAQEDNKRPKIEAQVAFRVEDTTINTMPSTFGNMLMPLTDGGLQFLLAGARANVGIKAGRYMFEVKVMEVMNPAEDSAARQKIPLTRNQIRIGFSTAGGSLFLGETASSVCFDTEGAFIHDKTRTVCSQKFGCSDVVAIVLNLDNTSPNSNTVSLFKNGERACQPQPLPEDLVGKLLYPAVTFKNVTLHYNFGPKPLMPLPFVCRMVQDASAHNANVLAPSPSPKDGKYEVIFPVGLPDEGTFDWLDWWLEQNPGYTELSDRSILSWCEKSGLPRPKGYAVKTSNDKPEMGFGVPMLDDTSIRRVIQAIAPTQHRNYVAMEVKSNLVKEERKEIIQRWGSFKRTAAVMLGEPPMPLKKRAQAQILKQKQEASDAEFRAKQAEEKRKKEAEKKQKKIEKDRQKALKRQKKAQEAMKKRLEAEKKKKAAEDKKEGEEEKEEEKPEEEEEEKEEEEEDEKEDEEMPEAEEAAPKVELTAEEKKQWFRKGQTPDLAAYVLSTSFTKFSVPEKEEGFDDVRHEWQKGDAGKGYLKQWVQDRKLTTRVEDLTPGDWFNTRWKDWQKNVQAWRAKQNQHKVVLQAKAKEKAAKEAKKAAKLAAKEAKEKAAAAKAKAAAEAAAVKEEKKEGEEAGEGEGEEKAATKMEEDTKEEVKEEAAKEEEEEEEEEKDEEKADFEKLDVFGVEDVLDVGGGEPLFAAFGVEDWAIMGLRFEIHLMAHAFRKDVNDPDRVGIHLEHLPFYYNKYYKKALNPKTFGVDTVRELLGYVRDTAGIDRRNQVVESLLPEDMGSMGVFVMLTEESRRDRMRRIDLGDDSAKIKMTQPQVVVGAGATVPAVRPAAVVAPQMGAVRPPGAVQMPQMQQMQQMQMGQMRPGGQALRRPSPPEAWYGGQSQGAFRPPVGFGQARPYNPQAQWWGGGGFGR